MSSLLNEAIVDAKALRAAALKNAETIVIEKYSAEVRETLEQLLEQEEAALGAAAPELGADLGAGLDAAADPAAAEEPLDLGLDAEVPTEESAETEEVTEEDLPLAATDGFADLEGQNLSSFPSGGEEVELTLDLGALQEGIENLKQELDENQEIDLNSIIGEGGQDDNTSQTWQVQPSSDPSAEEEEADSQAMQRAGLEEEESLDEIAPLAAAGLGAAAASMSGKRDDDGDEDESDVQEEMDLDSLADAIMEKLTVDMGADLGGWAGRSSEDQKWAMEKELAHRRSTGVEEELDTLKKAHEELVFENNQLNENFLQYKQAIQELKENLQDVNLSNARLLYTNRILRNTSLNERQKQKIAEAISGAGSVTEARTIFDTLQSTVEAKPKRSPQSLSEAIGRRANVIRATRQETPVSDPSTDRMKKLAGIK